ncbi:ATP-binding protein, partial [Pseudomonas syringae group genomosp. 3]|uniref:ATP-binding protein n=1 Tax=Pseudomonas syringae group genomosp. 3 TaxID=251701 RepID=UPI000F00B24D
YTRISVELNGRLITRDPATEKWDFEDEYAYYRAKEEGAVSIYNQGVLVRHDSSHLWGAGGLIVTKQAIALNVSRSEILRKTCPVWKAIAKVFGPLADKVSGELGGRRKTEARRARSALSLLSGAADVAKIFCHEEVITVLPGKRHITLMDFINKAFREHKGTYTVVLKGSDIPKGEGIAGQRIIQVLHPQTLDRFGCHSVEDFEDVLERVIANARPAVSHWYRELKVPQCAAFSTVKKAYVERTSIVDEKKALDKETRRAWIALRWCLQHYAGACVGAERWKDGTVRHSKDLLDVLLGESNTSEAWTDGKTYLAINRPIVQRLKSEPMKTAAYIFGLVEHEVAHQGDSLACGHDEAFYQRFHDISLRMAPERQRFMHKWLMKYTTSMEMEGPRATGNAWGELHLVRRVGTGRMKRGLSDAIEDDSADPIVSTPVPEQDMALLSRINAGLIDKGVCPPPPDWSRVIEQAKADQVANSERLRAKREADEAEYERISQALDEATEKAKPEVARILDMPLADIPAEVLDYLSHLLATGSDEQEIRSEWEFQFAEPEDIPAAALEYLLTTGGDAQEMRSEDQANLEQLAADQADDPRCKLAKEYHGMVEPGETWWVLERNAAAAGFWRVEDYLKWRHADQQLLDNSSEGCANK